jgi:hypothetical protein
MPFTEKPHRNKILHNGYCVSLSNSARSLPLDPAIIPPHNNNNKNSLPLSPLPPPKREEKKSKTEQDFTINRSICSTEGNASLHEIARV